MYKYLLKMTCYQMPEQYDVYLGDAVVGYMRLRHGYFYASMYECDGHIVYEADTVGTNMFEDNNERAYHIDRAILAIDEFLDRFNSQKLYKFDYTDYDDYSYANEDFTERKKFFKET